ncbi:hypothetical protein OKW42_002070 [Paraburkholderia sp. WC7.3d]
MTCADVAPVPHFLMRPSEKSSPSAFQEAQAHQSRDLLKTLTFAAIQEKLQ